MLRCALLNWDIRAASSPLAFLLLPSPSSAFPALSHSYFIVGNELWFHLSLHMSILGRLLFRIGVDNRWVNNVVFAVVSAMLILVGLRCSHMVWDHFWPYISCWFLVIVLRYLFLHSIFLSMLPWSYCEWLHFVVESLNIHPIVPFPLTESFAALSTFSLPSISICPGIHINVNMISRSCCSFSILSSISRIIDWPDCCLEGRHSRTWVDKTKVDSTKRNYGGY